VCGSNVVRRVVLCMIALAPALAGAQSSYGLAGGLSLVGPTTSYAYPTYGYGKTFRDSYSPGATLSAFISRPISRRLVMRFEASISHVSLEEPTGAAGVMCPRDPPPGTCCGICPYGSKQAGVGVASLTANAILALAPAVHGAHLYLIGGAGPDYVYQHPAIEGVVRFGVGAGIGCSLPLGTGSRVFVEARYQRLLDLPQLSWMVPVTIGMRY